MHARVLAAGLCALLAAGCGSRDTRAAPDTGVAGSGAARGETPASRGDPPSATSVASPGERVIDHYTAAALSHVADSLARTPRTGHVLQTRAGMQYLEIRRAASGVPEVHDRWADVTVIQAGRGAILTGGRVDGSHVESPGEHRGGTIVGGAERAIGAGDLLIIPAGIPHQYRIAAGDSLRYITVKVLDTARTH